MEPRDTTGACRIKAYKIARKIQLALVLFNISSSGVAFSQKIVCLSTAVLGTYSVIRLIFVQPFVCLIFMSWHGPHVQQEHFLFVRVREYCSNPGYGVCIEGDEVER